MHRNMATWFVNEQNVTTSLFLSLHSFFLRRALSLAEHVILSRCCGRLVIAILREIQLHA